MPNYGTGSIGTPAAASGAAYATFHTGAVRRASIYKIKVTNASAVFSQFNLFRSSNTPTASTSSTPQPYDAADAAATAALDTAWSVAPTVPAVAQAIDSFSLGAAQGSGFVDVWQSDKEIILAQSTWLVFWNSGAGAGGANSLSIAYSE